MNSIGQDAIVLLETAEYAAIQHRHQQRKGDKSSYIIHPLGVASILLHEANVKDLQTLQAAILHDTIEDTSSTEKDLEERFGREVTNIVLEVTDNKSETADQRKRHQVEKAAHKTEKAKLVKMADKLYNLRDLLKNSPGWEAERVQGYFVWAKKVVDQMRGLNQQLDQQFDSIWKSEFTMNGKTYPSIPQNVDLETFLENYYQLMAKK
eukprot:TRINITY_DN2846_c0_g1_i1.p1 TRINITY_DN2846_c0_g1~~TRINITY_DN2846_c0_g1_i1.p1  ORF type:complete len:208 (-),score=90.06 TRINITY_DN2846_c0_g1_i1:32-655(-)